MAGKNVIVGCKLPHGIIIEHPKDPSKKVELAGLNKAVIIGADYATTEVDEEFFAAWKDAHKEFGPILSGAIFEAKSAADVAAVAREQKDRKTGFERMSQNVGDIKPSTVE